MGYETVDCAVSGHVATITMNRPAQYNAFSAELRRDMLSAVKAVEADPAIRVCILRGAGRGFSAGGDLKDLEYDPISAMIDTEFKPFLMQIFEGDTLYIAEVHGAAAGIAAALAMACDFMVMAEDACLYMAFAAIALIPDGGNTWHLLRALGKNRALEMIVEGQKLKAEACLRAGLANKVVAAEDLSRETEAWAARLAETAPLAASSAKRLLREAGRLSLGDAISNEGLAQDALVRSSDHQRGTAAFFAKEKPSFEGN